MSSDFLHLGHSSFFLHSKEINCRAAGVRIKGPTPQRGAGGESNPTSQSPGLLLPVVTHPRVAGSPWDLTTLTSTQMSCPTGSFCLAYPSSPLLLRPTHPVSVFCALCLSLDFRGPHSTAEHRTAQAPSEVPLSSFKEGPRPMCSRNCYPRTLETFSGTSSPPAGGAIPSCILLSATS